MIIKNKVLVYLYQEISIPEKLKSNLEAVKLHDLESIKTMRLGEDIVLSDGDVPLHTDGTEVGKDTVMLVISARGGFVFNHEYGDETIQSGDLVRFDGNKNHGLTAYGKTNRFCAIIWDVPVGTDVLDLIPQFNERLIELNKGTI